MADYSNLEFTPGEKNIPGLKTIGYYVAKADIANFPELASNPASAEQEITLPADPGFVLKAGKNWKKLYSTEGKAKIDSEPQGELDNESFKNKAEFFYPGLKDDALAFAKKATRDDLVFIFVDRHDQKLVIGNTDFRTITKATVSTGDATTSTRGTLISIECDDENPLTKYAGAITPVLGDDASGA